MSQAIDDFTEEQTCEYRNELYRVRDNGAVLRLSKGKKRPLDNQWTFGKVGDKGYLYLAGVQVHRIVATAFHKKPIGENLVVDHLDTNKQNNRPENLDWKTREDNILSNPNTSRKIEFLTGKDIHEVIKHLDALPKEIQNSNQLWYRPTNQEEANNLRARQEIWREEENNDKQTDEKHQYGEWLFSKPQALRELEQRTWLGVNGIDRQAVDFYVPTEFCCRPELVRNSPLEEYLENCGEDELFSRSQYHDTFIIRAELNTEEDELCVLTLGMPKCEKDREQFFIFCIRYELGCFFYKKPSRYDDENIANKVFDYCIGKRELDDNDPDLFGEEYL